MNFYELLNCDPSSGAAQIDTEFKLKAKNQHPDKGGDNEKFKELIFAREILIHSESRNLYDLWLTLRDMGLKGSFEDWYTSNKNRQFSTACHMKTEAVRPIDFHRKVPSQKNLREKFRNGKL